MDCFHDSVRLAHHIVIPESQHAMTFRIQPAGAIFIATAVGILSMLRTIDLDDQAFFLTGEVRNIGSDRDLSPKMASSYLKPPKVAPKDISAPVVLALNALAALRLKSLIGRFDI
jgi:hypothetical protein